MEKPNPTGQPFSISIVYNGLTESLSPVTWNETVNSLLNRALNLFKVQDGRHIQSLWLNGRELPDAESVREAGITSDAVVLLRPSAVKGG